MAGNPDIHLPAINHASSPAVAKKLSMAQASKLHSHSGHDHSDSSTSSPCINGSTQGKLLLHMPYLQQDDPQLSPTQSPGTHRRIQALLSPSVSRRKLLKNVDWKKSQSVSNLDIPKAIAVEFHSSLEKNASKSRSTPRLLQRDIVTTLRTNSPLSYGSDTRAKSGSSEHTPLTSTRRQKSDVTLHKSWKSKEKIDATRHPSDVITPPHTRLHNNHGDAGFSHVNPRTPDRNQNHKTSQWKASNASGHSENKTVNKSELISEESEEYTKQLYSKCQHWLEEVADAKEHHSLERVIETPVTWAD